MRPDHEHGNGMGRVDMERALTAFRRLTGTGTGETDGERAVISGPWVNPRHGRGPRDQVTALANRGTEGWRLIMLLLQLVF